jgi:MinD-like ATPase involved in chromosome partitioning or flagellar assembly
VGASRQEWGEETRISARDYDYILQDFDSNLSLKVFSGILQQAKRLFEIMRTERNDINYCFQQVKGCSLF